MKKHITIVVVLILAAGGVIGLVARQRIAIRYHAWQADRLYARVMMPDATDSERKYLREDVVIHADRLVQLEHWQKKTFEIAPMPKQESRVEFMDMLLASLPPKKDSGYFQFWGEMGTNGPRAFMNLWCRTDHMPKMEQLLHEKGILIEEEGQQNIQQVSPEAAPSAPPDER